MSVKVGYSGRLGNNILQYLMGQYIADKFGLYLDADIDLYNEFEVKKFSHTKIINNYVNVNDHNVLNIIELKEANSGFFLNGYFSMPNVIEKEDIIRFYKTCLTPKPLENNCELCIHIRLGDIAGRFNLPYQYYHDQIIKASCNNGVICVEPNSANHPIVQKLLKKFNLNVLNEENPSAALRYGANCKKLILSSGTFSLCMAILNRQNPEIYCIDNQTAKNCFGLKQWDGNGFASFLGKSNFHFYKH